MGFDANNLEAEAEWVCGERVVSSSGHVSEEKVACFASYKANPLIRNPGMKQRRLI